MHKKTWKKLVAVLMAATLVSGLTACGKENADKKDAVAAEEGNWG